jgi:CTP synthase (UTP-ammonia lyase)
MFREQDERNISRYGLLSIQLVDHVADEIFDVTLEMSSQNNHASPIHSVSTAYGGGVGKLPCGPEGEQGPYFRDTLLAKLE